MARRKSTKVVTGLELEPGGLVAARARVDGRLAVDQAAVIPVEPHVLRDGEVTDVEALTAAVKALWSANKGLGKAVRVGVANARIVVRTFELPLLDNDAELAALVRHAAEQELPMPLDHAVLDFHVIERREAEEGPRQRVVVVAARRDMVERVLAAVRGAGLKVEGIDLSAFAMVRALRTDDEPTLYLSVGGLTNLAVADRHGCGFTRVTGGGLDAIVVAVAERLQVPLSEARSAIFEVGLETPIGDFGDDAEVAVTARTVLSAGVRQIAGEARSSLDFHQAQSAVTEPVERVVLTGPASAVPGFAAALEAELGLLVELRTVAEGRAGAFDAACAAHASVAAGLAVEDLAA